MPNGGHISCVECCYNRLTPGKCDIWGIKTSGFILCRAFRFPKQSHTEAREKFKIIKKLKSGIVYSIDNSLVDIGNPEPIYELRRIK